jgi:hypothetical protein
MTTPPPWNGSLTVGTPTACWPRTRASLGACRRRPTSAFHRVTYRVTFAAPSRRRGRRHVDGLWWCAAAVRPNVLARLTQSLRSRGRLQPRTVHEPLRLRDGVVLVRGVLLCLGSRNGVTVMWWRTHVRHSSSTRRQPSRRGRSHVASIADPPTMSGWGASYRRLSAHVKHPDMSS